MPDLDGYHEDAADRIEGERHAGLVTRGGEILLVGRRRHGLEYWVLPGGHRRDGESGADCVIREVFEETGIRVGSPELIYTLELRDADEKPVKEYYYACRWVSGDRPFLAGEEARRSSFDNTYLPVWVGLDKLPDLNLLPPRIKLWLCENYSPAL